MIALHQLLPLLSMSLSCNRGTLTGPLTHILRVQIWYNLRSELILPCCRLISLLVHLRSTLLLNELAIGRALLESWLTELS